MTQSAPDEYRWVRYDGPETRIFIPVGEWVPGDAKHVPADLAAQLLRSDWFTAAEAPALAEMQAEPEPPKSRKTSRAATEPAATSTQPESGE